MPKIKVKNIPAVARERVCDKMYLCSECPFYLEERFVIDENTDTGCMVDYRYDPEETIVELPEKEFPTNREWMESLSDAALASFLTDGYVVKTGLWTGLTVTISVLTHKDEVIDWLNQPCAYLVEEEQ